MMPVNDSQKYIALILLSTLLAAFSLASLLTYTDPAHAGWTVFGFIYLSAFLLSLGLFTLLGLAARRLWFKGLFNANLAASFRQGLLLSFLLVTCLSLSAHGLLYWWVVLSLILPVLAIEAFLNLKL